MKGNESVCVCVCKFKFIFWGILNLIVRIKDETLASKVGKSCFLLSSSEIYKVIFMKQSLLFSATL